MPNQTLFYYKFVFITKLSLNLREINSCLKHLWLVKVKMNRQANASCLVRVEWIGIFLSPLLLKISYYLKIGSENGINDSNSNNVVSLYRFTHDEFHSVFPHLIKCQSILFAHDVISKCATNRVFKIYIYIFFKLPYYNKFNELWCSIGINEVIKEELCSAFSFNEKKPCKNK